MMHGNDPYDELAELFLTDTHPDDEAGSTATAPPGARITLCVVGHLPVRAGLWLSPYAAAVARGYGTTALVRIDDDAASIELFGASTDMVDRLLAARAAGRLDDAIADLAVSSANADDDAVQHWILRPSAAFSPSGEGDAWFPNDETCARIDDVHVLTGVDDAAVVAAYQSIKRVAEAASETGRPAPAIGLAVVGTTTDAARQMVDRLNRTARSFLGVETTLAVCLHQIGHDGASSGRVTFDTAPPPNPRQLLQWISAARERIAATRFEHDTDLRPDEPPDLPPQGSPAYSPRDFAGTTREGRHHSDRISSDDATAADADDARRSAMNGDRTDTPDVVTTRTTEDVSRPFKLRPKPVGRITLERKAPGGAREPDRNGRPIPLANYIEGVTDLPVRCPGYEHVDIGVDPDGVMHLMTWEQSLRDLYPVSQWARRHRELIAMACREHPFASAALPRLHVLTGSPQSVADLHASDLHLHVVAPVTSDRHTTSPGDGQHDRTSADVPASDRGWFVAQLNCPTAI